jgi:alanine racemase
MTASPRPTWIEVSRGALVNNVRAVRQLLAPSCRLMAVVKANAYGHGAADVARIALDAGAAMLAVASLSEALDLRRAGIDAPTLVLGYTPGELASGAVTHDVRLTVYDPGDLAELNAAARALQRPLTVHVKVNTGMNRLGVQPAVVVPFMQQVLDQDHLRIEGLYTHFATSDDADKRHAWEQFARFEEILQAVEAAEMRPPLVHAANSAAVLTMPATHLDMVRSGIAIYGLDPDAEATPVPPQFHPALTWKARIAQVRRLQPGDAVSYGREFIAERPMTAAVIPVGYADGFPRKPLHWQSVLIHGQPAPILGRVCMDQTIVDVSALVAGGHSVRMGDEVVIIGRQGGAEISAEEAGRRIGTINYDVTSRILARVPRVLVA